MVVSAFFVLSLRYFSLVFGCFVLYIGPLSILLI